MKLFRGILVVLTLVTLCLLVSAEKSEDAAEWGILKNTFTTRATFYGECERKNTSLWGAGTCGEDTQCFPKDSGCKGSCACDKSGVNECKCRGLYGGGMRKKTIELFDSDDADLGKVLGDFLAGVAKGRNDVADQFKKELKTEQCQSEVTKIKKDIPLDLRVINYYFRKALDTAEDRPSEEAKFEKSFEGEALSKIKRRYHRLVRAILNILQKGLVVASKCGVEEKSVKLLGVTSAALVMKDSYLLKKDTGEATKRDITKITRSILEYIQESAGELHNDLTKERFFKVLGNVASHLFGGMRNGLSKKELLGKFGFHDDHTSLEEDVEALVSSEGSIPEFKSSLSTFKITKKNYFRIPLWLKVVFYVKKKFKDLGEWFKERLGKKSKFQPGTLEHPFKNRISKPWGDIRCVDPKCASDNKASLQANEAPAKRVKSSDSGSFLETSSSSIAGTCGGVPASQVFAGIDTSCKSSYDISVDSTPNLIDCLMHVAGSQEQVTFTRGDDFIKLSPGEDTVNYKIKCEGGRRRLLQLGGKGGSS